MFCAARTDLITWSLPAMILLRRDWTWTKQLSFYDIHSFQRFEQSTLIESVYFDPSPRSMFHSLANRKSSESTELSDGRRWNRLLAVIPLSRSLYLARSLSAFRTETESPTDNYPIKVDSSTISHARSHSHAKWTEWQPEISAVPISWINETYPIYHITKLWRHIHRDRGRCMYPGRRTKDHGSSRPTNGHSRFPVPYVARAPSTSGSSGSSSISFVFSRTTRRARWLRIWRHHWRVRSYLRDDEFDFYYCLGSESRSLIRLTRCCLLLLSCPFVRRQTAVSKQLGKNIELAYRKSTWGRRQYSYISRRFHHRFTQDRIIRLIIGRHQSLYLSSTLSGRNYSTEVEMGRPRSAGRPAGWPGQGRAGQGEGLSST